MAENESQDLTPEPDVNSDQGFMAMLEGKGLGALEPESERGDLDRFAPAAQDLPDLPLAPAPVEEETGQAEPEQDSAVAAFLAEHGGDSQAALEALLQEKENRESLIGRQGSELGDLREQVARLEGRLDEQQSYMQEAEPLVGEETVSALETMFEENGAQQSMNWLAENRPDLIEHGLQVWAEQDPFNAGRFAAQYDTFLREEEVIAEQGDEPQVDPILAQMRAREQFAMLTESARSQLGIGDEAWPIVREHVVPAFNDDAMSPLIKNAIISEDPQVQLQGMIEIVRAAHARALSAESQQAETQATKAAATEAEQRKMAAQVASGSLRPAAPEGKSIEEMTSEEKIALWKQSLLAAPTTSVADGLTFGPQQ